MRKAQLPPTEDTSRGGRQGSGPHSAAKGQRRRRTPIRWPTLQGTPASKPFLTPQPGVLAPFPAPPALGALLHSFPYKYSVSVARTRHYSRG